MEFLEVPIFDDDLYKLIVRLVFNLVFALMIIFLAYRAAPAEPESVEKKRSSRQQDKRNYTFTFLMMNVMVFFVCFTLKKLDLGLGMALGLFAIFAIIRYRTDAIRVKEMTYLFIVIGIAVINALSNKKTSYAELLFANMSVFGITILLEKLQAGEISIPETKASLDKKQANTKAFEITAIESGMATQKMTYDRLDLLHPEKRTELLADITQRTGIAAETIEIAKIDLSTGTASISVAYSRPDNNRELNK